MGCAVGQGFTVVSDIHNHRVRNSVDVACGVSLAFAFTSFSSAFEPFFAM